ncbi:hypothetical protein CFP65_6125 [Kitasatospora sp. MMS16-BH015]|uniref:hypothetical protein n=1 Tax=Kitasatospora sp. MMS16-BH015 TaxID=2018025 RepID=UPI000CA2F44C|nr:hypothetical protein [Kitasatospora sp. MMS16-BH015]AUG80793.1 hypothetical protein CFP65_6125 [Kitasatospora sp. MMS16-BH015]
MGWYKSKEVSAIALQAKEALADGRRVFVCRLNKGTFEARESGSLPAVAELIETVEALGWALDKLDFDQVDTAASAFLLFRRARPSAFGQPNG